MICARGKSKHRTLKLAARVAAGRFALRSGANNRAGGWLPLVLRWRRRRQARQTVNGDRVTSLAPILCFPQNHFHFATYLTSRVTRPSVPAVLPAGTIYRERIVRDRSWTNVLTINRAAQSRQTYDRINYVREGPPPKSTIEMAQPFRSSRVFEPIPTSGVSRQRGSLITRRPATVEVNTRREELTQLFKTHGRIYEHQPQVFPRRLPAREPNASVGPPKRKQTQFTSPEELVWRRVQPLSTVGTDVRNANALEPNQNESGRSFSETPAQQTSTPLARAAQQQITKIDPSLLDRITDDVIRRVEQRARIERQRRGL